MGTQLPLPQRGHSLQLSAHICWGQMAGWIKMPLGMEVGLGPGDFGRWGPSSPLLERGGAPNFRRMSIVAKRLNGSRCTWHGGGPRSRPHCARWGPSSPPPKRGHSSPPLIVGPCLLWPNGWMDQDATWYGSRPRPRRHCVRWGPSSPPLKGHRTPSPIFGQCPLWPNGWMDEDATWYVSGVPRPHCVRRKPSSPLQRGTAHPQLTEGAQQPPPVFRPCLLWPRSPTSATAELFYKRSPQKNHCFNLR